MFKQKEKRRFLISMFNRDYGSSNCILSKVEMKVKIGKNKPVRMYRLPECEELDYKLYKDYLVFTVKIKESHMFIVLECERE